MSSPLTPPGGAMPSFPPRAMGADTHQPGSGPWPGQPMYQPAQRNGIAVAAVVMSGLSLLGVLGLGAVVLLGGPGMGPSWVLRGEVQPVDSATSGTVLERELTSLMEEDRSSVRKVRCPESTPVGQGEVAVCHGTVDDFEWTGVVHFEDDAGAFTLLQF